MSRPRTLLAAAATFGLLVCSGCDFEDIDQDGDGLITVDELITATCLLFCPPDEEPLPEEPPVEEPSVEEPPTVDPMEEETT